MKVASKLSVMCGIPSTYLEWVNLQKNSIDKGHANPRFHCSDCD